jgi:hypothetical protein
VQAVAQASSAAATKPAAPAASARSVEAPAVLKVASATPLPAPALAKPVSATPAKPAPIAAPAASERSAKPTRALATPSPAPSQHQRGSPAVDPRVRDALEELDQGWRDRAVASAPSPALAQGMRVIDDALDLVLGSAKGNRSPIDPPLPTLPVSTHPPELAAAGPTPVAVIPSLPESARDRLGFAFPVLESLTAQLDDFAAVGEATGFADARRLPPALRVSAFPEPASALLIGAGLAVIATARRRNARG